MAGFWRNLFTLLLACFGPRAAGPRARLSTHFRITPFDTGIATLKSDKYLHLVEAAQLDFVVRTGLFGTLLRQRIGFVNAAQQVRFARPVRLGARVRVDSQIAWWDERCAWFSHRLHVRDQLHAQVWVKMKFKQRGRTVDPRSLVGPQDGPKPDALVLWDRALDAAPAPTDHAPDAPGAPAAPHQPSIREPETP